jgi:hypothetical protein
MIRVLGTTNPTQVIAEKVAGFPPHTNLHKVDAVGCEEEDEEDKLEACEGDVRREHQARCRARREDGLEEVD